MKPIDLQNAAKPTFSEIASQAQNLADGASLHAKGQQLYVSSNRSLSAVKEFLGFPADRNAKREAASQKIFEAISNEYGPAVANQIRDSFRGGTIPATKEVLATIDHTLKTHFRPLPQDHVSDTVSDGATVGSGGPGPASTTLATDVATDVTFVDVDGEDSAKRLRSLRDEAERLGMTLTVARFDRFDAGLPITQDEFDAMISDLANVNNRLALNTLLDEFDGLGQKSELDVLLAQVGEEPEIRIIPPDAARTGTVADTDQIDQLIAELMGDGSADEKR